MVAPGDEVSRYPAFTRADLKGQPTGRGHDRPEKGISINPVLVSRCTRPAGPVFGLVFPRVHLPSPSTTHIPVTCCSDHFVGLSWPFQCLASARSSDEVPTPSSISAPRRSHDRLGAARRVRVDLTKRLFYCTSQREERKERGEKLMDRAPDGLESALGDYAAHRISRRELLKRAGLLGVAAAVVGPLVASGTAGATTPGRRGKCARGFVGLPKERRELPRAATTAVFTPPNPVANAWADPDFNALFEALVMRNPAGEIVPMLADKFSSGPQGWTFHLRDGLKFQSGVPLTAAAVVEGFNLFRSPKTGQNGPFWTPVTNVTASGQDVICATTHPFQAFQETVTTEYSYIMDPDTWKADGAAYGTKATNGTGPFILTSFSPSEHVVAQRWEDYPGSIVPFFQNHGKAYLDSITWISITDASERAPQIQTGLVDAIKNPPPQDVDTLKDNPDIVVLEYQELSNFFLSVNMADESLGFNDLRVRQAISHAIDRQAIVESIFLGHAVPTYGPVMTKYKWYNPAVENFNQFNLALAESLLDDAVVGRKGLERPAD